MTNKNNSNEIELGYIQAIGDNLQTWLTHLCFELNEQDYYRLNEII